MKPKLAYLVPSLDGIPPVIAQLYELIDPDKPEKGFRLCVDDLPKPAHEDAPERGDTDQKNLARDRRDQLVDEALRRLQVRDESKDAATKFLKTIIKVEAAEGGELVESYRHPSGWRWPSSLPGKDFIDGLSEVVLRLDESVGFKKEWRRPAPPDAKTQEQLDHEDSIAMPRVPRNVRISPSASQHEFEAAHAEAAKRGGRVIIDQSLEAPPPPPSLSYRPGKDVPALKGCSQAEFEVAFNLAALQGGMVVFVDE